MAPPKKAAKTDQKEPAAPVNARAEERVTPVRAKPVVFRQQPKAKEPPDLVRVRALERGQYGLDVDIIIRNPGEVFDMATSAMRVFPLAKGEHPVEDATIIETPKGQFELPGWVELVEEGEEIDESDLQSHGHNRKWHGQVSADGTRSTDVL
jgi:hypothetical protein